ncbi:MAG: SPOR domain-containing protein [Candidatus Omnitrophica bacterium]|nr:SPOR domain-containing protein [Candidatus Omnitrophota bacterium]
MNINYKEPQFELFPANSATLEDINKPKFLLASLTLSTESLVILLILAIMIALFSFSLGVERGRSLVAQSLDEKVASAWNVGGRRLAVPPVAASIVPQVKPTVGTKVVSRTNTNGTVLRTVALAHSTNVVAKPVMARTVSTTATTAVSTNKWTVQVATYKNENYAKQEALGLKAKGYPSFIVKSKDFYLVCVGQFGAQTQADSFFKRIQAKYQGSQVRRF